MARLIDADAFIEMMEQKCDTERPLDPIVLDICKGGVKMMPTVDAVPVKHGRWEMITKQSARCTACGNIQFTHGIDETMKGHIFYGIYRYCPNCGAKMEVEHE